MNLKTAAAFPFLRPSSANVAFLSRRIQCKLAQTMVFAHLHLIQRDRNATFELGLRGFAIKHSTMFKISPRGKKKEEPPTTQEAIQRLRSTEELLQKKSDFLEKKIENEVHLARKNASMNKRGSISITQLPYLGFNRIFIIILICFT